MDSITHILPHSLFALRPSSLSFCYVRVQYVDLDYSGLGIGEYQFFDTYAQEWDTSACEAVGNGVTIEVDEETGEETKTVNRSQCKRMDCHLPSGSAANGGNWQLMGYFKEVEYTEWFEQLVR